MFTYSMHHGCNFFLSVNWWKVTHKIVLVCSSYSQSYYRRFESQSSQILVFIFVCFSFSLEVFNFVDRTNSQAIFVLIHTILQSNFLSNMIEIKFNVCSRNTTKWILYHTFYTLTEYKSLDSRDTVHCLVLTKFIKCMQK